MPSQLESVTIEGLSGAESGSGGNTNIIKGVPSTKNTKTESGDSNLNAPTKTDKNNVKKSPSSSESKSVLHFHAVNLAGDIKSVSFGTVPRQLFEGGKASAYELSSASVSSADKPASKSDVKFGQVLDSGDDSDEDSDSDSSLVGSSRSVLHGISELDDNNISDVAKRLRIPLEQVGNVGFEWVPESKAYELQHVGGRDVTELIDEDMGEKGT
jgi:hypothetical protein